MLVIQVSVCSPQAPPLTLTLYNFLVCSFSISRVAICKQFHKIARVFSCVAVLKSLYSMCTRPSAGSTSQHNKSFSHFSLPTQLFSQSLSAGVVLDAFKAAYITPLLKSDADPVDVTSNPSVVSKLLERLMLPPAPAARQLGGRHAPIRTSHHVRPASRLQSTYQADHSTETAMLKVLWDTLLAIDTGDSYCWTCRLQSAAAFDKVNEPI